MKSAVVAGDGRTSWTTAPGGASGVEPGTPGAILARWSGVTLLILSWLAVAELLPLDKYGDLYREQVFEEQNEAWREKPVEEDLWRQPPPTAAGTPRVRFGYDPSEEHLRNLQRLEQNRSSVRETQPNPIFQIGF